MSLPKLKGVGDDFQAMIQHSTGVGVVVAFGCG